MSLSSSLTGPLSGSLLWGLLQMTPALWGDESEGLLVELLRASAAPSGQPSSVLSLWWTGELTGLLWRAAARPCQSIFQSIPPTHPVAIQCLCWDVLGLLADKKTVNIMLNPLPEGKNFQPSSLYELDCVNSTAQLWNVTAVFIKASWQDWQLGQSFTSGQALSSKKNFLRLI